MKVKYRGSLSTGEVVDIIKFDGLIAKCTDAIDRHIDDFNTIFYSGQQFKKDILKAEVEAVEKKSSVKKTK